MKSNTVTIGVRFCGGCNPRFDRLKLYKELTAAERAAKPDQQAAGPEQKASAQISWQLWQEGFSCDAHLFINGCPSECLMSELPYEPVLLLNSANKDQAAELLAEFLKRF